MPKEALFASSDQMDEAWYITHAHLSPCHVMSLQSTGSVLVSACELHGGGPARKQCGPGSGTRDDHLFLEKMNLAKVCPPGSGPYIGFQSMDWLQVDKTLYFKDLEPQPSELSRGWEIILLSSQTQEQQCPTTKVKNDLE